MLWENERSKIEDFHSDRFETNWMIDIVVMSLHRVTDSLDNQTSSDVFRNQLLWLSLVKIAWTF